MSAASLRFRVSDSREWASATFMAPSSQQLCAAIRRAWDEYTRWLNPGLDVHPAFALRARFAEIDDWLAVRLARPQATREQIDSWQSQARHWRWKAEDQFGLGGMARLDLQVQGPPPDGQWMTPHHTRYPGRWAVTREVSLDECEGALRGANAIYDHAVALQGLYAHTDELVGEAYEEMDAKERARRRARLRRIK